MDAFFLDSVNKGIEIRPQKYSLSKLLKTNTKPKI